jgi:hypothetical protein
MESDIRSHIFDELWATDATPTDAGATTAAIPKELGYFLHSHAEQRGSRVRLNAVGNLTVADADLRLMPASPVVEEVTAALPWRVTSSDSFTHTHHINLQEANSMGREVTKTVGKTASFLQARRQLLLCDSSVCVGAFSKGRSSSFKLNDLLRKSIPYFDVGHLVLALLWIATSKNPSDYPSRFKPLPPPKSSLIGLSAGFQGWWAEKIWNFLLGGSQGLFGGRG